MLSHQLHGAQVLAVGLLTLLAVPGATASTCEASCQQKQQQELLEVYANTGGFYWSGYDAAGAYKPVGWGASASVQPGNVPGDAAPAPAPFSSAALPAHCTWSGVYCCIAVSSLPLPYTTELANAYTNVLDFLFNPYPADPPASCKVAGGVAALGLSLLNMTGPLPSMPMLATSLEVLDISNNAVSGNLSVLEPFTLLRSLNAEDNQLRHLLASSFLPVLSIARSDTACCRRVTGSLTPWLTGLVNLMTINVGVNAKLSGTIPPLAALTSLRAFQVDLTALSGQLPADWISSATLRSWDTSYCNLSGTIPPLPWADYHSGIYEGMSIRISHNRLTGTLPLAFHLGRLGILDVSHNMLTGNLATSPGVALSRNFNAGFNNFSGTFPNVTGYISGYTSDSSGNTQLTGGSPVFRAPRLTSLAVAGLTVRGNMSPSLYAPRVVSINISGTPYIRQSLANSNGDLLPEWLRFVRPGQHDASLANYVKAPDVPNLVCLQIATNDPVNVGSLQLFTADASAFDYQFCKCLPGLRLVAVPAVDGGLATKRCVPVINRPVAMIAVSTVTGLMAVLGSIAFMAIWIRQNRHALGPPGPGQPLTLVMTDIEGSTELWEAMQEPMLRAQRIHDSIMRARQHHFHGFELGNDGDSFSLCFCRPKDAVAWCLEMQRTLFTAAWPGELEQHPRTALLCAPRAAPPLQRLPSQGSGTAAQLLDLSSTVGLQQSLLHQLSALPTSESLPLFRGLRVRMSIVTGVPTGCKVNKLSGAREYLGPVVDLARAQSNIPYGGMILCDQPTLEGIRPYLAELYVTKHGRSSSGQLAAALNRSLQRSPNLPRSSNTPTEPVPQVATMVHAPATTRLRLT